MAKQPQQKEKDKDPYTVITPDGVACFVHVWEPHAFPAAPGEKPKEPQYGLILVFDEDALKSDAWDNVRQTALRAAKAKFGNQFESKRKNKRWSWGWRDASDYAKHGEPFVDGSKMIICKAATAPGVVDSKREAIENQMDFYPGCIARASLYAHAYEHPAGNLGITFLLNNVQKRGDGEKLAGARKNAEEEFDDGTDSGGDDAEDLF